MSGLVKIDGKTWRVLRATASRIVLVPAGKSPVLAWREKAKLTQRAAAEVLGLSQPTLHRIERGDRPADDELLARVAALANKKAEPDGHST